MGEIKGRNKVIYSGGPQWASSGMVTCGPSSWTRIRREGALVHVSLFWSATAVNGSGRWYLAPVGQPPMKMDPAAGAANYHAVGEVSFYDGANYYTYHALYKGDENLFFFGNAIGSGTQVPMTTAISAGYALVGAFTYQAA